MLVDSSGNIQKFQNKGVGKESVLLFRGFELQTLGKFVKSSSKQAKQFDIAAIEDKSLKRQFELLLVEGISALDEDDFNEYNELQKQVRLFVSIILFISYH